MKERFVGRTLFESLQRQDLVACDASAARYLAKVCKCIEVRAGETFITDGEDSADVFMILQGTVDIAVNGQVVASRSDGQHVGEMAALLESPRTASVIARDNCVLAKVPRKAFLLAGAKFPNIWRGIARALAKRLDQRRNLIREPNLRPFIFIVSATESLPVAKKVKALLNDARWEVQIWDEDEAFPTSSIIVESLAASAKRADFGVVIFGRDDKTNKRGGVKDSPRDNSVLEAGIFLGAVGLHRTYVLVPGGKSFQMPSDFDGVIAEKYTRTAKSIDVSHAVVKLRKRILQLGVR